MASESHDIRVLLVSRPVHPASRTGSVDQVRLLATHGRSLRCTVLVPVGAPPPAPGVGTIPAALPSWMGAALARPGALLCLLSAPRFPVRHFCFTPTPLAVRVLRLVIAFRPGPTVQTFCSTPPDDQRLRPLVFADRVVTLSSHTQSRLLAEGVPPERLALIPPAVIGEAPPDLATRQRLKARLGVPPEAPIVLYMGDYDAAGAALAVADALPRILAATDAHVVFACRPKGERFAAVRSEVQRRVALLGEPARRVHFLGFIPWAPALAAAVDLALFPARRLPDKMDLPLALLQSLSAGVPAVVSTAGPLGDLVAAGAAVGEPPGAPERLAAAAVRLLRDPDAHLRASRGARAWCAIEASPERLVERHGALYRDLLAASETRTTERRRR